MTRHHGPLVLPLLVTVGLLSTALPAASAAPAASPGRWRQLGPDQRGFGEITTLAADPTRPERVLAGLKGGGVARSGDGGRTWRPFGEGLASPQVDLLAVHPALGRLIYAVSQGYYLQRSVNDGRTWTVLPLTGVRLLELDPRDPNVVWAAAPGGLYRSADRGDNWRRIQANLPAHYGVQALAIDPVDPRRIYAGITGPSGSGFWVSENGGRSWARRSRSVPHGLLADLHTARTVYFLRDQVIHRSRDAGRTWERFFDSRSTALPGSWPWLLAADPRDAAAFYVVAYLGGDTLRLLRTGDGGRTWRQLDDRLPVPVRWTALAVTADGTLVAGGKVGFPGFAAFRSEDRGDSWEPASRGLVNTPISAVAVTRTGAIFAALLFEGAARSLDGGATWTSSLELQDPQVTGLVASPHDAGTVYATTRFQGGLQYHFLWRTTDNGGSWQPLPYPAELAGTEIALDALDLAIDPADPRRLFVATALSNAGLSEWAGVFRSEDSGETWEKVGQAGPYHQVETHPGAPARVLALSVLGLYRSTDHGGTWERVLDNEDRLLHTLAVAPSDPDVAYVLRDDGMLLRSLDGGATFASLGKRLPGTLSFLRAMVVDPLDPDTLFFQGDAGVVRLTLGRGRGEVLDEGLIDRFVPVLLFDPNDPQHLFGGTSGAGLFEYRLREEE